MNPLLQAKLTDNTAYSSYFLEYNLSAHYLVHVLITCWYVLLMVLRDEDWEDNDGALNTISMTHPRIPTEHPNRLVVDDSDCHPLQPGIWLVLRSESYFNLLLETTVLT